VTAEEIRGSQGTTRTAIIWSVNGRPARPTIADMLNAGDLVPFGRAPHAPGYNRRNAIAGGCTEERDEGVSDFGREYIQAMTVWV